MIPVVRADKLFDVRLNVFSEWSCKLLRWCRFASESSNDWLLVCICINRIAAITWPTKLRPLTTVRASVVAIAFSVLLSCSVNILVIWDYSLIEWRLSKRSNVTHVSCSSVEGARQGLYLVLFFEWFFPMLVHVTMFIACSLLCIRLVALAVKRHARWTDRLNSRASLQLQQIQVDSLKETKRELQLAVAFMTMTIVDVVLDGTTAFLNGLLVTIARADLTHDNRPRALRDATYKMQDASMLLRIWNFYAYIFIMPSFRYGLFELFMCCTRGRGQQRTSRLEGNNRNEQRESISSNLRPIFK